MEAKAKHCQNCKQQFGIDPEDFSFYEKIQVPPPTFCPECRMQRRLAFANIFFLYKRPCDLCKKEVISRYSPEKGYIVYCPKCWWSDKWEAREYGREYDFSRPFFEQFEELRRSVPLLGLSVDLRSANESPYTNDVGYLKNCYLLFTSNYSENCSYGHLVVQSKDCVNSSFINSCELSFDSFHCYKVYNGVDLNYTLSSNNSAFLWQCTNCSDCFASVNLKNKRYQIFNNQYTKEEYEKKIKEYDLGSYQTYQQLKKSSREHWLKFPVKTFWQEFSQDVSGLFVFQSKNCKNCFEVTGGEDCRFTSFILVPKAKDSYDYTMWGDGAELVYESVVTGEGVRNVLFGDETGIGLYDAYYTKLCTASSNLFGCVGVNKKSYCILNKQYGKEQYEKLVRRIIAQMNEMPYRDTQGNLYRYGEFFPMECSPFAYNETLASQYYPLTENEVRERGYAWKQLDKQEYRATMQASDLPDHIGDAPDTIIKEVVACMNCARGFTITKQELAFSRKLNVPLSRTCFYCRIGEKLKDQPHPMKLWNRRCQCGGKTSENKVYTNVAEHPHKFAPCPDEFQTSYAPERPEIVYCKECYQMEII